MFYDHAEDNGMETTNKSSRGQLIIALVLFTLIGLAAYWPYLSAPFLHDDLHTIRDNPALEKRASPVDFFRHPESASALPSTLVRPLLTWSYALNLQLFGPKPFSFHLVNLFLHVLNSLLVVLLTRSTRSLKNAALPAGLLFLILPINSILVGYISCRSTLLSATFYLGALILFARVWEKQSESGRERIGFSLAGIILLYAAGMLVKSVVSTLPLALLVWALCFRTGSETSTAEQKKRLRLVTFTALSLFAVLGLYFIYRGLHQAPSFFPAARPWPVWQYLAAQPRVFFTYLKLIAFPAGLSIEHEAWVPMSPSSLINFAFITSAAGIALMLGLALRFSRRAPEISFAALFSITYLLPTSSIIPLVVVINENRPYLSALVLIWPLALAYQRAREKRPLLSSTLLAFILAMYVVLLISRASAYQSEEAIWRDAVKKAPGLSRAHVNLGVAWKSYGRIDLAEVQFKKAIALEPCNAAALNNLANIYDQRRDRDNAETYYRKAIICDPQAFSALVNLADLLSDLGREEEARELLEQARAISPEHPELKKRMGEK